jgi:hypothetical protein
LMIGRHDVRQLTSWMPRKADAARPSDAQVNAVTGLDACPEWP